MSLDVFSYMWIIPMKLDVNPGWRCQKAHASAGFRKHTQSYIVLSGNFPQVLFFLSHKNESMSTYASCHGNSPRRIHWSSNPQEIQKGTVPRTPGERYVSTHPPPCHVPRAENVVLSESNPESNNFNICLYRINTMNNWKQQFLE